MSIDACFPRNPHLLAETTHPPDHINLLLKRSWFLGLLGLLSLIGPRALRRLFQNITMREMIPSLSHLSFRIDRSAYAILHRIGNGVHGSQKLQR